ncbi:MAG: magnesium transporter [Erysipelotrichales bacterium]|nr:magnesium transporter [Erysipelotrichales bacterium]
MEERIRSLIEEKDYKTLKMELNDINEKDLGEILSDLSISEIATVFRLIKKDNAVLVFAELDVDVASQLLNFLSDKEAVSLIDEMAADDAADVLEEMPANIVDKILKNCSVETRKDVNRLLNYEEDSAGSIMTVEYSSFKENMTVKDAIKRLKEEEDEYETINTCYVVDHKRVLLGSLRLQDLLFNDNNLLIKDIYNDDIVYVHTSTDQEQVAAIFQKYDVTVMPVVDSENRLVGIITVDDVLDVFEEEATEDMKKMAAIIPVDKPYSKVGVFSLFKARIPWLLLLMVSATFTGGIIQSFESQLATYTILTAFIPMIMDTGGNAGGQASVSIIRALSLHDIEFKDLFKVWFKEVRVALLCSLVLAIANFIKMLIIDKVTVFVAATVCVTLCITVLIAKSFGCLLPMLAKKLGFDPAVMASPFITTVVDACSLLVYFQIASLILGL